MLTSMMVPARERAERTGSLARELCQLPFTYIFHVPQLGSEVLSSLLPALRPLQLLRRRELVGHGAGFAPTDMEDWTFHSGVELQRYAAAARLARSSLQLGLKPSMLLGATLRLASEHVIDGALATSSVGLEWVDGPAADPLQLGLCLLLGPGEEAKVDLELGSGAWTPWAETWALRDGTLRASIAVVAPLPDGKQAILKQGLADGSGHCEALGVGALRDALAEIGEAGLRVAICLTGLRWCKEAPAWCPLEVLRVAVPCAA